MKAFIVTDIRTFMAGLLNGTLFKSWEFRSLEAGLISHVSIDGKINRPYLTEEERNARQGNYLLWDEIQPKVKMLIQGGHTPSSLSLTMAIPPERITDAPADSVESYQLNIRFETTDESGNARTRLMLVTGVSTKTFSMDKTPDRVWDQKVPEYFRIKGLLLVEA